MALKRPQNSIYALLILALCSKAISTRNHTPTPTPSPSPSPSPSDESPSPSDESPSPSPTPSPSEGPTTASPISISKHFELLLPSIGVLKASVGLKTEGAKVTTTQLEGIERKIDEFKSTLTKRIVDPKISETSKKCLAQCQEDFEEAIDGVKISIESINKRDLSKANVDISGIATDIETCNDCFKDLDSEDKEINAFNEWIKGVTKECLINLKKA